MNQLTAEWPMSDRSADCGSDFVAFELSSLDDPFLKGVAAVSPFQTPAFLRVLEETISQVARSRLLLIGVRDGQGHPVALFPFATRRRLGARVIEGVDFDVTDYFAPILLTSYCPDPAALWGAVRRALPAADVITIKKVPQQLNGHAHALTGAGFLRPMGAAAYATSIQAPFDATRFSAARDVRRKSRKLAAIGSVEFNALEPNDSTAALDLMFQFRLQRFAALGRPDPLSDPAYRLFYQRLAAAPERLGRVFTLTVAGEIIAVLYALCHRDSVTLLIPTISPDRRWMPHSPGLVALYRAIEWATNEGYARFDLSVGSFEYKGRFDAERTELFEFQQALTPLGLPVVADSTLRRWLRCLGQERPWLRQRLEWVRGRGR